MAGKILNRPEIEKPGEDNVKKVRLSNVRVNRNTTTTEMPKTIRLTAAEKSMCASLTESVQELTTKNISDSTILRAALYMANQAGAEKILKAIKEYI